MSGSNLHPVPYRAPRLPDADTIRAGVDSVLASGVWNRGPLASRFERAFAARAGVSEAVLCSSATAAMTLLLRADAPDGAILLPAFQFPPVLAALRDTGLPVVLVDVDPDFWTVRSRSLSTAFASDSGPKETPCALLSAPSFGDTGACRDGEEWSARTEMPVWFDSCHAFGTALAGQRSGSFGRAEVFSLTPSKLVIGGEGGVVTTDDSALAEELRVLRDYGKRADGTFDSRGASARASEWTASLALASLSLLTDEIKRRNAVLAVYREELNGLDGIRWQSRDQGLEPNGQECVLRIDSARFGMSRDGVQSALRADGIESIVTYLKCLSDSAVAFPVAAALENELLHLPMGVNVDREVAKRIAQSIAKCAAGAPRTGPSS